MSIDNADQSDKRVGCAIHLEDLQKSGLTRDTWEAAAIYSEADPKRIGEQLAWKGPAKKLGACLAFPYHSLGGTPLNYIRFKPSTPRPGKDGKPIKYEAPRGRPPHAYFPPMLRNLLRANEPLVICEGEKKALAGCQAGFATIGLAGIWSWKVKGTDLLLPELDELEWVRRRVKITFDSDRIDKEDIRKAEIRFAAALNRKGAIVRVVQLQHGPNGEKTGIDDFFVRGGTTAEFQGLLDAAIQPTDPREDRPSGKDGRLSIIIGADECRMNDEAVVAMANDPELYSRAGMLVRVVNEAEESVQEVSYPAGPRIAPVSAATLRERLTVVADWYKFDGKYFSPKPPPKPAVDAIRDRGTWPGIRRLISLIEYPVLLSDGSILATPGYHRGSGLLYLPRIDANLSVPDRPTLCDARRAVATLMEMVSDFPFAAHHHRASFVASLLTPLARYAYRGCSPFFLIEANVPAAGKGLLADLVPLIVQGSAFAVTTLPDGGEEFRKRVTSILIRGSSMALFDNLTGEFGFAELDALLTSLRWSDRVLGVSQMVDLPVLTTWYGTGNNVAVVGDTARRVCPIRLESLHERPEERTDITRLDLRGWVLSQRPRLLSAALTILRAYHAAGRPNMNLPQWGSYENWSFLVRGAVVWAGMADPWQGRAGMRENAGDDRLAALSGLLRSWEAIDSEGSGLTCAGIVTRIDALPVDHALHDVLLVLAGSKPSDSKADKRAASLGYSVRRAVGRVIAGRRLKQAGLSSGIKRWVAEMIDQPDRTRPSSGDGGDSGDTLSYPTRKENKEEPSEQEHGDSEEEVVRPIATIDTIPTPAGWTYSRADLGGIH